MSEHTPGPWAALPPNEFSRHWFICRDRGDAPLGVVPKHLRGGPPFYIGAVCDVFGTSWTKWPEVAEANARLIAAAPELLEVSVDPEDDRMVAKAQAAIAKVRGQEQGA